MKKNKVTNSELQETKQNSSMKRISPVIFGILFIILQIVCYTWILQNNNSKNTLETAMKRNILRMDTIYESMVSILNDEDFTSIHTKEDMDTEAYIRLQNELNQMRKLKSLRYLYTAGRNAEGTPVYLVDGLDLGADDFAYPGTTIEEEMISYLEDALSGNISYCRNIMDTTWGHIFAACYPVYSKQNPEEVIGVLCMEIDMESTYNEIERNNRNATGTAVIAAIITSILTIMAYLWMKRLNKLEINRRKQLDEAYKRTAKANIELEKAKKEIQAALEEADRANSAKTTFLFNMSHDIRTPMNAIIGFAKLLETHQEEPEKRADYLRKIEESSAVLLSIINNVLEMSRIEKGTLELDETAWSAEQFNDTLYSIFHEMMTEKGIEFIRKIDVEHPYVFCDPIKLREIFINILSNAYKYTNPGGQVSMNLEEIPSDREGYALYRTSITDTGIGMSEEFIPHIYEEFSREHNTTDARVEGTGLGMPIVKRLVEIMEGTIEIKSKKGVGSTFIVTIPHRIAEKSNLVEHAGVELDPKLFQNKRILLAEDNELNAEIAMEILSEAGFIVELAEDGKLCVDKLRQAKEGYYDLILMDIQMPHMNGYDATRIIRTLPDPEKADIPILAMTANAFEEDKREAIHCGMNGHLAKPIDVHELMRELANILG